MKGEMMDPNAALAELLDLARVDQSEFNDDVHRMAELVLALHESLAGGGVLPAAWVLARTRIVQDSNYLPSSWPDPDARPTYDGGQ